VSLLQTLETIRLECDNLPDEKNDKKALRMDGTGIREQLGLNNYNCCDYLLIKPDSLYLTEISDFISQYKNLEMKGYNKKKIEKIIRQEIRLKIMGSLVILFKIPTKFSISHEKIHTRKIKIILVLCSVKKADVLIFKKFEHQLKTSLFPLITEVKVMDIAMFKRFSSLF